MQKFLKNNWQLILIEGLVLLVFVLFYGRFGDVNIDSFREAFIPEQILAGKILYKDIFTINAPFAYLFNALLFLVFGVNLKVLYLAGLITSMGIIWLTYKIARKFMEQNLAIAIALLITSAMVLSPNVFNSIFPYSYGMLYGLFFILLSINFALKNNYFFSCLFYSLAIFSTYEFIFLLPILIYSGRNTDWKKNIIAILTPVLLILVSSYGIQIGDIINSIGEQINIGASKTANWYYSTMGLTFSWKLFPSYIINLIKFVIPIYWVKYQEVLIWAYPAILLGLFFRYKHLNTVKRLFVIASLLISSKVFFALTLESYGVFYLPFALISLGILTPHRFREALTILFLMWSIVIGGENANALLQKDIDISTSKGIIKTNRYNGRGINKLLRFMESIDNDKTVVIYPEGLSVNFLSDKKGDSEFYSLIPLYVESFGENAIIEHLSKTQPDYIIISDYDTSAYYYSKFGQDYAISTYDWINSNYKHKTSFTGGLGFEIYEKSNNIKK